MYIESIINDYAERSDVDASSFQFLITMSEDYKNQIEMDTINKDGLVDINSDNEVNDLPF
jgi:hypothetical protein